jgi:Rrf2 family nitric oxide-sensitive transcriptional repressor
MELRRSTGYGIQILLFCAHQDDDWTKVASLATRLGLTPTNTYKIVRQLKQHGFVVSKPGRVGGIRLARASHKISLGDVLAALQPASLRLHRPRRTMRRTADVLHAALDDSMAAFVVALNRHSIAHLRATM